MLPSIQQMSCHKPDRGRRASSLPASREDIPLGKPGKPGTNRLRQRSVKTKLVAACPSLCEHGCGSTGVRMRFAEQSAALVLSIVFIISPALAQTSTDADLQKEAASADSLYRQQNFIGALPLYEDLHSR